MKKLKESQSMRHHKMRWTQLSMGVTCLLFLLSCGDTTEFSSSSSGKVFFEKTDDSDLGAAGVEEDKNQNTVDQGTPDSQVLNQGTPDQGLPPGEDDTDPEPTDPPAIPPGDGDGLDTPEDIVDLCMTEQRQVAVETLVFTPQQNCSWNQNGNGARIDRFMQARESQVQNFTLPPQAIICDAQLESSDQAFHYDDFLYLTAADYLLMGSNTHFVNYFNQTEAGLKIWNWDQIFGKGWGDTGAYCIPGADQCQVPPHDQQGPLNLAMGEVATSNLALQVKGSTEIPFSLIATGDNDNGDCFHSGLELEVTLGYVLHSQ